MSAVALRDHALLVAPIFRDPDAAALGISREDVGLIVGIDSTEDPMPVNALRDWLLEKKIIFTRLERLGNDRLCERWIAARGAR